MRSARINITPELLTFAREKVGYSVSEMAGKLNVKSDRVEDWEKGKAQPTTNQLIKLANQLERTPGFFLLDEPPEEKDVISEFRTLRNLPLMGTDPKLIKVMLEAKRNRLNLIELYVQQNKEIASIPKIDRSDTDFISQGKTIRRWLDIDLNQQFKFTSSSNALTSWKTLIESKDIYIIQFTGVSIEEARGFAMAEDEIPVIGINSKDSYTARIFTLIHELVHILLRDSVIINDELTYYWNEGNSDIETFCNQMAAEILVPSDALQSVFRTQPDLTGEVYKLSRKFRVSPFMMSIRLKNCQLINQRELSEIIQTVSNYKPRESRSSGGDPYRTQIVRKGKLLISNAFQSYFDGHITLAELSKLTQWKVPNLNKLAAKTYGWEEESNHI